MKIVSITFLVAIAFLFINCEDNKTATNEDQIASDDNQAQASTHIASNQVEIVGEWKRTSTIIDKNANNKIEDDERANAMTQLNDYMKLNGDGSAIFSQVKMKGRYEIKPNSDGSSKYLNLFDEANTRYSKGAIISVSKTELVLLSKFSGSTFSLWKRL
jgi:hypothetical protein